MDSARFGGFIEGGGNDLERFSGFFLFAGADEVQKHFFESVQAGLSAMVAVLFSSAVAHATFGGLRIGHKTKPTRTSSSAQN